MLSRYTACPSRRWVLVSLRLSRHSRATLTLDFFSVIMVCKEPLEVRLIRGDSLSMFCLVGGSWPMIDAARIHLRRVRCEGRPSGYFCLFSVSSHWTSSVRIRLGPWKISSMELRHFAWTSLFLSCSSVLSSSFVRLYLGLGMNKLGALQGDPLTGRRSLVLAGGRAIVQAFTHCPGLPDGGTKLCSEVEPEPRKFASTYERCRCAKESKGA